MNGGDRLLLLLAATAVLLASPAAAGTVSQSPSLRSLVRDVLARTTSTSEVLTLNLTNLIILIVIKAVIIVGGMFLFGGGFNLFGGGGGFGRSSDEGSGPTSWVDRDDMLLMLTYILGDGDSDFGCLNRVACEQPDKAKQYISAGKLLIGGAKMADGIVTTFNPKYEKIVMGMQEAVHHAQSGGVCSLRYSCKSY